MFGKTAFLMLGLAVFVAAHAEVVTFDVTADGATSITAPEVFYDVNPSPAIGPALTGFSPLGINFTGGVILKGNLFNNASNLLATADFIPLHDDSLLPGSIKITFDEPVASVHFRIINGLDPATGPDYADFTVRADTGQTSTVRLNSFMTPGDANNLGLTGDAIRSVIISSDQPLGNRIFGIDNLSVQPVPEPSTVFAVLGGVGLLARKAIKKN